MKIRIKQLAFETIIGILEAERLTPQPVLVEVSLSYHFDGKAFIDYAKVCDFIQEDMHTHHYYLLEDALVGINQKIRSFYPQTRKLSLTIFKPSIVSNALVGVSQTFKTPKN